MRLSANFQKSQGTLDLLESQLSFSTSETPLLFVNVPKPNGKIILKLQLNSLCNGKDSISLTFSNLSDRDACKDWISSRLKPVSISPLEIQARQQLLSQNEELGKTHREWVVQGGWMKEEEFWQTHAQQLRDEEWLVGQKKGTLSSLLSDLKPSSNDGSNDLKYTLNAEIIHSIFTTFPAVAKAYQENVPHLISEKEFWTKYFSSQYFYRNRMGSGSVIGNSKDFFDKYAHVDQEDLLISPKNLIYTPCNNLLDLSSTMQDHSETGNRQDVTMRPGSTKESLGLIRRFNRHSDLVLKSLVEEKSKDLKPVTQTQVYERVLKLFILSRKETEIPDLTSEKSMHTKNLNLGDPSDYYPGEKRPSSDTDDTVTIKKIRDNVSNHIASLSNVTIESFSCSKIPKKLYNLINDCQENSSKRDSSLHLDQVVSLVSSANELLRHAWSLTNLKMNQENKSMGIQAALEKLCQKHQDLSTGQFSSVSLNFFTQQKIWTSIKYKIQQSLQAT